MNKDLLEALVYMELAHRAIERANKVLWLDHTLDEVSNCQCGLRDDMNNEARRLNVRVMPVRVVA